MCFASGGRVERRWEVLISVYTITILYNACKIDIFYALPLETTHEGSCKRHIALQWEACGEAGESQADKAQYSTPRALQHQAGVVQPHTQPHPVPAQQYSQTQKSSQAESEASAASTHRRAQFQRATVTPPATGSACSHPCPLQRGALRQVIPQGCACKAHGDSYSSPGSKAFGQYWTQTSSTTRPRRSSLVDIPG